MKSSNMLKIIWILIILANVNKHVYLSLKNTMHTKRFKPCFWEALSLRKEYSNSTQLYTKSSKERSCFDLYNLISTFLYNRKTILKKIKEEIIKPYSE